MIAITIPLALGGFLHLLDLCKENVSKAAKLAGKYWADFYALLKKPDLDKSTFKKSE